MTQALMDAHEIEQAHYRYARALDRREWILLHSVFTPDAVGFYGSNEPVKGAEALIANARNHLGGCGPTQHMMSHFTVTVDGDVATSACYLRAFHQGKGPKQHLTFETIGGYEAKWRRTSGGWRAETWRLPVSTNLGDISVLGPP